MAGGLTVLTNDIDHTIQGSGYIGRWDVNVVNKGTIIANQSTALYLQGYAIINSGLIQAKGGDLSISGALNNSGLVTASGNNLSIYGTGSGTNSGVIEANGATLTLYGGNQDNAGGIIRVKDNSMLELGGGVSISGGALTVEGNGIIRNTQNTATLIFYTNNFILLLIQQLIETKRGRGTTEEGWD